ncbi:PPC domain-containing protein [Ideonella azotifigens]|uniref:Peptidase C-terminal archaeal/bacterial domain-containing protein n=1 Tax=Ideonella azotifigens TaxID=513160 RepID=A0ABP3V146_9BURK|nr:PPC domain-containing protein [Ideonella azotifigens]MCD2340880.1 PPC domain-containing protein [Ideonella azotifigens]
MSQSRTSSLALFSRPAWLAWGLLATAAASAASDPYKTPASSVGAIALANDTVLAVSDGGDTKRFYTIDVPEGAGSLTVSVTGGSGDADMWMAAAGKPVSKMHYDCYTGAEGNNDVCTFYNPKPGRYTVMLSSIYIGGYTDAQLLASYTLGTQQGPKAIKLASGVPAQVSGAAGSSVLYKVSVPKGTSHLVVSNAGGSGDVSLSMKYQQEPSPDGNGCGMSCDQGFPKVGTWYVKVTGNTDFQNVALTAQLSTPSPLTDLGNGVPLTGLSGSWGDSDMHYYKIDVPEGAGKLTVATTGSTSADLLMYVSRGEVPSWWQYDCSSDVFGNGANETCVFPTPKAGTYYIGLRSFDSYSNVALTATYELGGGGYTGAACPSGTTQHVGTLYRGQAARFKFDSAGGKVGAKMTVQTDFMHDEIYPLDFDLYLEQKIADGQWQVIGSSTSVSTDGTVTTKTAPAGMLRWTVTALDGSGDFRLCTSGE